jgi:hypothetical protein
VRPGLRTGCRWPHEEEKRTSAPDLRSADRFLVESREPPNQADRDGGRGVVRSFSGDVGPFRTELDGPRTEIAPFPTDLGSNAVDVGPFRADRGSIRTDFGSTAVDVGRFRSEIPSPAVDVGSIRSVVDGGRADWG